MSAAAQTTQTAQDRRAHFDAIDAVEHARQQMGALRAIEALTIMEKVGSEESMGMLRRNDLAMLLCLVTTSIETTLDSANAGLRMV